MKADNDMGVKSGEVSNSGLRKFFSLHDIDYVTRYLVYSFDYLTMIN
jgi:hypothetical protein